MKGDNMTLQSRTDRGTRKVANPNSTVPVPSLSDKRHTLQVNREPGKSEDRQFADLVTRGIATNATTAMRFVKAEHGELSITDMVASLRESGCAVNSGDFAGAEQMLNAQAIALNAIFAEMARRSAMNLGENLAATESYMRLALKAQGQCRSTLESLAAIKNPPVFARQMNVANGLQQVNNGGPAASSAHTPKFEVEPNELSGGAHELPKDTRTPEATSRANHCVGTFEQIDGAKDGRR